MKKLFQHAPVLLMLGAINLQFAQAQGTAFTYQGQLHDGATPASGIYDLRFTICDSPAGGTQQGVLVTNAATAVSNGLFTVTLDFGKEFPGTNRWLEIDGVELAAIQGLNQKLNEKEARLSALEKELSELRQAVKKLSNGKD